MSRSIHKSNFQCCDAIEILFFTTHFYFLFQQNFVHRCIMINDINALNRYENTNFNLLLVLMSANQVMDMIQYDVFLVQNIDNQAIRNIVLLL